MRIAVCFFGITRNFARYTLDSMERNLFAKVAKLDPNFRRLAHFNRVTKVDGQRSREKGVEIDPEEYKLLNCHVVEQTDQEEVDRKIDFEHISQFGDYWHNDFNSLKNLLRQFYSLNAVTDLLLREKTWYDMVIFSRADLRFEAPVEIPSLQRLTLYTAWFQRYNGLNDRFGMGDMETMAVYGRRQCKIREYCAETRGPLTSEHYLHWYAQKMGLNSRHLTSMNFSRVRSNGTAMLVDVSAKEKLKYHVKQKLKAVGLRRY